MSGSTDRNENEDAARAGGRAGKGAAVVAYFGPPAALLAVVLAARALAGIPISQFTRDPTAVLGGPFYIGLVSNAGALLWCAAAACCFLGFAVVRKATADARPGACAESARFLLASGAITTLLLLDDLFQLHEEVYRVYLHVPERVVVLVYGTIVAAYFWRFRKMIRRSEYGWLIVALGFFGVSVIADQLAHLLAHLRYLVEDGAKFLGIAGWFAYHARTSAALMGAATVATAGGVAAKGVADPTTRPPATASASPALSLDLSQPSPLDRALAEAFAPAASDRAAAAAAAAAAAIPAVAAEPPGVFPTTAAGVFDGYDAAIPELRVPSSPPIMR